VIWTLLVGNTRAVASLMKGMRIISRRVVLTDQLRSGPGALSFFRSLSRTKHVQGILIASVVPPVDQRLRQAARKVLGKTPHFVTHRSPLGGRVGVLKPAQAGADRLANAVAARELYGKPAIVVDYGTGTTFDVVDRSGAYVGGAILPGIGISLRALHDFTAKIPKVPFERTRKAVGRTTEAAVRSGVYHGAIGTTRELLRAIRREVGPKAPAIATGGWCRLFRATGLFDHIDPDLTQKGMALIWRNLHALD
jgi:type III pantothenate kinase